MTQRVLLGNSVHSGNVGLWVSKPGVNVMSIGGNTFIDSIKNWYGYQEEFPGTTEGTSYGTFDPASGFFAYSASPSNEAGIKRTANGTLAHYANGSSDTILYSKDCKNGGTGKITAGAFVGSTYPVVEMKVRLVPPVGSADLPAATASDMKMLFASQSASDTITSGNEWNRDFRTDQQTANSLYFNGGAQRNISLGSYTDVFTDNEWKYLEWDWSDSDAWTDTYKYMRAIDATNPHPYSGEFFITRLGFDLTHNAYTGSEADGDPPMWEIDYVRVKKKDIPIASSPEGSADDSLLFSTDWTHSGLIHQTGLVQIGNGKATIDGLAEITNGLNRDNPSAKGTHGGPLGHVEIVPPLDYIPLILFQRVDAQGSSAYPAGQSEFSYSVTEQSLGNNAPTLRNVEIRTFAYIRASNSYFELTCRGALARDGLEWAFNYSNQYTPSQGGPGDVDWMNYYPFAGWGDRVNPDFLENREWTEISDDRPGENHRGKLSPGATGLYRRGMGDWGTFPSSRILHKHANTAGITAIDPVHPIRGKHWMGLPWVKAQGPSEKTPSILADGVEIESSININEMELHHADPGTQLARGNITSFWGTTSQELFDRFSSGIDGKEELGQSNTTHPYELKNPIWSHTDFPGTYQSPGYNNSIVPSGPSTSNTPFGGRYPSGKNLFGTDQRATGVFFYETLVRHLDFTLTLYPPGGPWTTTEQINNMHSQAFAFWSDAAFWYISGTMRRGNGGDGQPINNSYHLWPRIRYEDTTFSYNSYGHHALPAFQWGRYNRPAAVWMTHHTDGAVSRWNHSLQDPMYSMGGFDVLQLQPTMLSSSDRSNTYQPIYPEYGEVGGDRTYFKTIAEDQKTKQTTFYFGANTSGVCHPYGVVPLDGSLNISGQEDPGTTIDGVSGVSTYFSNYSVTNNQTSYIGGSPYKNVFDYNGDGTVANTNHQKLDESEFSDLDYSHNTPTYRYYVLRVPAEYIT